MIISSNSEFIASVESVFFSKMGIKEIAVNTIEKFISILDLSVIKKQKNLQLSWYENFEFKIKLDFPIDFKTTPKTKKVSKQLSLSDRKKYYSVYQYKKNDLEEFIPISMIDFKRLDPKCFLNDTIISFFLM